MSYQYLLCSAITKCEAVLFFNPIPQRSRNLDGSIAESRATSGQSCWAAFSTRTDLLGLCDDKRLQITAANVNHRGPCVVWDQVCAGG